MDSAHGIQIVKIGEDRKYQFDEEALKQILLQDNIKDCPVVVVSVAGAYRGGKSFLLDFFLRYLYYKYVDAGEGHTDEWLGDENEPLKGFGWRGGSERDTTGILLWSQPIPVCLPCGKKVVVLLMDTQGTFDSRSTVRDCSTIFALSVLLSSAQIYNLSQNINEDDLQHLQLFTEYGRLLSSEGERPFQRLQFLVRDWSFNYEHPYGAAGGEQLLTKRLQISDDLPEEMHDVRKRIHSCFDSVDCFLMPHPGFGVTSDPRFNGKLSDIRDEFKTSLLELVPIICDRDNLKVKLINGQPVKARDFVNYFKVYMTEFSNDNLPTPLTFIQATAKASLLSAVEEVRRQYRGAMDATCGAGAPSLAADALRDAHESARAEALKALSDALQWTSRFNNDQNDSQLLQIAHELDQLLAYYRGLNDKKNVKNEINAKQIYEENILIHSRADNTDKLCLHPDNLDNVNFMATKAALESFDSNRIAPKGNNDSERMSLVKYFDERLELFQTINKKNNLEAVEKARSDYVSAMLISCGELPCMNQRDLQIAHEESSVKALGKFKSMRNIFLDFPVDVFRSNLNKELTAFYDSINSSNNYNNEMAVKAAHDKYCSTMERISKSRLRKQDQAVAKAHVAALEVANNVFYEQRQGPKYDKDQYLVLLDDKIDTSYSLIKYKNRKKSTAGEVAGGVLGGAAAVAGAALGIFRFMR